MPHHCHSIIAPAYIVGSFDLTAQAAGASPDADAWVRLVTGPFGAIIILVLGVWWFQSQQKKSEDRQQVREDKHEVMQERQIAGLVVQAPSTTVVTTMLGAIASQTSHILSINTGTSESTDGTVVGGFTNVGRLFAVIPSYANDAAADADTALPSGGLYKITGARTVYAK